MYLCAVTSQQEQWKQRRGVERYDALKALGAVSSDVIHESPRELQVVVLGGLKEGVRENELAIMEIIKIS